MKKVTPNLEDLIAKLIWVVEYYRSEAKTPYTYIIMSLEDKIKDETLNMISQSEKNKKIYLQYYDEAITHVKQHYSKQLYDEEYKVGKKVNKAAKVIKFKLLNWLFRKKEN